MSEKAKQGENRRYDGHILQFADNTRYEGKLNKDGMRDGMGKMTWSDGLVYTGDFKDGMRHGHGLQQDKAEVCIYKGDWADDLPHGFGTITWLDGTSFNGQLEKGRLKQGKYIFASGNLYEGQFSPDTGKFHGKGQFTSEMEFTDGTWSHGKLNGQGVRKYVNGDEYSGNWVEDQLEGEG